MQPVHSCSSGLLLYLPLPEFWLQYPLTVNFDTPLPPLQPATVPSSRPTPPYEVHAVGADTFTQLALAVLWFDGVNPPLQVTFLVQPAHALKPAQFRPAVLPAVFVHAALRVWLPALYVQMPLLTPQVPSGTHA
jgi:hypothetical protein